MKKLVVDAEKCFGCGNCVTLCPKVFALGDDVKARVVDQNGDTSENIAQAITNCPSQAIGYTE